MNRKQAFLILLLADFTAVIGYALYQHGLSGMVEMVMTNAMSIALTVDLLCALGMGMYWTHLDAQKRGINSIPYLVLTALTGSVLLTLAHQSGKLSFEAFWDAAHVDEDWNRDLWGEDEEANRRRAKRLVDAKAASFILQHCR